MLSYPRQAAPVGLAAAPGAPTPWGIFIVARAFALCKARRAPQLALLLSPVRTVGAAGYALGKVQGISQAPGPMGLSHYIAARWGLFCGPWPVGHRPNPLPLGPWPLSGERKKARA